MSNKKVIYTSKAPSPIGPYSQAVQIGNLVFISGQIALDTISNLVTATSIEDEIIQVFENIKNICEESGATLNDIVKINLYLTDLTNFNVVNNIMAEYFTYPYPARAAVEVTGLPKGANFEAEAILALDPK
jgi:2-iminobutanoate/2-iminopropanoate deaminase